MSGVGRFPARASAGALCRGSRKLRYRCRSPGHQVRLFLGAVAVVGSGAGSRSAASSASALRAWPGWPGRPRWPRRSRAGSRCSRFAPPRPAAPRPPSRAAAGRASPGISGSRVDPAPPTPTARSPRPPPRGAASAVVPLPCRNSAPRPPRPHRSSYPVDAHDQPCNPGAPRPTRASTARERGPADTVAVVLNACIAVRPSARLGSGTVPVLAAGRLLANDGGAHHPPHRRFIAQPTGGAAGARAPERRARWARTGKGLAGHAAAHCRPLTADLWVRYRKRPQGGGCALPSCEDQGRPVRRIGRC